MIKKELLEKIIKKQKEIKAIGNLSSRDFRFKNWHASTMNLLKSLPSDFIFDINDFKKLTFTDTKYHRGKKFFNPKDDTQYREDLDSAAKILKKITSVKKEPAPSKKPTPKKKAAAGKDIKRIPAKKGKSATGKKTVVKGKAIKSKSTPKKPPVPKKKKASSVKTKKIKKK